MTKVEIIKYVRHWFENHPRSINPDKRSWTTCLYRGQNGERCAFALFVKEGVELEENVTAWNLLERLGKDILKDEVQGTDGEFWNEIQAFHDSDNFWETTETGNILTIDGAMKYEELLRDYQD